MGTWISQGPERSPTTRSWAQVRTWTWKTGGNWPRGISESMVKGSHSEELRSQMTKQKGKVRKGKRWLEPSWKVLGKTIAEKWVFYMYGIIWHMSSNSKKRKKDIKYRSTICIAGPIFEIYPIPAQMESSPHSIKSSRTTAVPVPLKLNCLFTRLWWDVYKYQESTGIFATTVFSYILTLIIMCLCVICFKFYKLMLLYFMKESICNVLEGRGEMEGLILQHRVWEALLCKMYPDQKPTQ